MGDQEEPEFGPPIGSFRPYLDADGRLHIEARFESHVSQLERDEWCLYLSGQHPESRPGGQHVQVHVLDDDGDGAS